MRAALVLLVALLFSGCASQGQDDGLPDGIAVLGDSISRATNVMGERFGEFPQHAWATGADPDDGVTSHFERLRGLDPTLDIVPFNDARSGARMSDLARQAEEATRQRAAYVVILMGANDACADPMTPVDAFRAQLAAGAEKLDDARVLVASVPDVTKLVALYADNATARAVWDAFDVCQSALAPSADLAAVRARIVAYNEALREEADARGWAWDGGAVFATAYQRGDVSEVDYFHPSLAGQARLADVTWAVSPFAARS